MNLDVLFEDNHCLAVNKPAGLLSQGDASGDPSLVDLATLYLKTRYPKPGNVYVGLLHRLDRPTSGVVLLAKTSKAAGRLSAQFRAGRSRRFTGRSWRDLLHEEEGEWVDLLEKDPRQNRSGVVLEEVRRARKPASHSACWNDGGVLPSSSCGRQPDEATSFVFSSRDGACRSCGDVKYGAKCRLSALDGHFRIALHARQLTFMHPTRPEAISVDAPVPADWPELSTGWPEAGFGSSKRAGEPSP